MKNIASVLLYGSAGLSAVACTTMEKTKTSADIPVPAGNPF